MKYGKSSFLLAQLTMISAQSGLFWWKKKHKRSYELVSTRLVTTSTACSHHTLHVKWLRRHHPGSAVANIGHHGVGAVRLQVTLLGLWLVPAVVSFYFHFWRFLLVWAIFSVMSGFMFYLCSARRLDRTTPRRVGTVLIVAPHLVALYPFWHLAVHCPLPSKEML